MQTFISRWVCYKNNKDIALMYLVSCAPMVVNKNMASLWGYRNFYKARISCTKRIGPHSWEFVQVLVGLMLGDGHMGRRGLGVRIQLISYLPKKEWPQWLNQFFYDRGYNNTSIEMSCTYVYNRIDPKGIKEQKIEEFYNINTFSFSSLITYHEAWYSKNGIKRVPIDIGNYLTPLCVAVWYMGDGSLSRKSMVFCTDSFTKEDVLLLISELRRIYGINPTLLVRGNPQKPQYRIQVNTADSIKLSAIIRPYMTKDTIYRLPPF